MKLVLHLAAHQPYRVRDYTIFDAGKYHDYFADHERNHVHTKDTLNYACDNYYLPINEALLHAIECNPEFRASISVSGMLLEHMEESRPDVLQSFRNLVEKATGRIEVTAETYYDSLAFFYNKEEFEEQVRIHAEACERLLGYKPHSFRNTGLSYSQDLGLWASQNGYEAVLAEGSDKLLSWRSPNYCYRVHDDGPALLARNQLFSEQVASGEANATDMLEGQSGDVVNVFLPYESNSTSFIGSICSLKDTQYEFATVSGAAREHIESEAIEARSVTSWLDDDRDLSSLNGSPMQQEALKAIYELTEAVMISSDHALIRDWRMLQTSCIFRCMDTKPNAYGCMRTQESPYETQMSYMNVILDIRARLARMGIVTK
ncbi:MAG: hypothetical protein AAF413_03310 [Patescibacteria group bacterium]